MIDPIELAEMAESVRSWTGIVGEAAFKIAAIAIEYQRPNRGRWKNNT